MCLNSTSANHLSRTKCFSSIAVSYNGGVFFFTLLLPLDTSTQTAVFTHMVFLVFLHFMFTLTWKWSWKIYAYYLQKLLIKYRPQIRFDFVLITFNATYFSESFWSNLVYFMTDWHLTCLFAGIPWEEDSAGLEEE